MPITELKASTLNVRKFVNAQVAALREAVGDGLAINALSGGVDSSVVTMLGHRALGRQLRTYFINNGIMRAGEPERVIGIFRRLGVPVTIVDAQDEFFRAFKGVTDPEAKREAVTQTFYRKVFGRLVRQSGAKFLLQGTILTDVEETKAGIKRQHNVFAQIGIDPQRAFGYRIIEPVLQLRKDGVRKVAKGLGLPRAIYQRPPFPGPALAARVIGEVTRARIALVRQATAIVEAELAGVKAFQCLAILHEDKVTGLRRNRREFGYQLEVRCWNSVDARVATPTNIPFARLTRLADRLTAEVAGVVSVTYNIASKPPSTIEAV